LKSSVALERGESVTWQRIGGALARAPHLPDMVASPAWLSKSPVAFNIMFQWLHEQTKHGI